MKIFWEFPLTVYISIFLVVLYFGVTAGIPHPIVAKYFYSYPGKLNFVNWFLSSLYHSSVSHLLSNVMFLYILGRAAESKITKMRWISFYMMAGIISMMADSIIRGYFLQEKNIPAVGASGAISGIAAVAMVYSPLNYKIGGINFYFPVFLIAWLMVYMDFLKLFSSDHVAHWAHLAGFFSVFVTSYFFSEKEREKIRVNFLLNLLFFLFTVILLFFLENR